MKITQLTFDNAHQELNKIDSEIAEALAQLEASLPNQFREELVFAEIELSYSELLLENGKLTDTLSNQLKDFVLPSGLPVGIVTEGALEIFRRAPTTDGHQAPHRISDVRLNPGSLVGIFEALRYYLRDRAPVNVDWNIASGLTTLYTLDAFTGKHRAALRKKYHSVPDHKILQDNIHIPAQMREIEQLWSRAQEWVSKVLFFPASIFSFLYDDPSGKTTDTSIPAMPEPVVNLRRLLAERPWPSAFQEIEGLRDVFEYFDTTTAAEFCRSLLKLNRNEKMLFSIRAQEHKACPSELICNQFLLNSAMDEKFLAPCYIKDVTQCGFIPLTNLFPTPKPLGGRGKSHDNLDELLTQGVGPGIKKARASQNPIVDEIEDIFSRLVFKIGKGGNSKYYNVNPNTCTLVKSNENDDPFWTGIRQVRGWKKEYVPTNVDFFSLCVRVNV